MKRPKMKRMWVRAGETLFSMTRGQNQYHSPSR